MQLPLPTLSLLGILASGLTLWVPINAQAALSNIENITIYQA